MAGRSGSAARRAAMMRAVPRERELDMVKKLLALGVLGCALCGAGRLRAQTESVLPGQALPPEVKQFQVLEDQWSKAVVDSDVDTMQLLLSPLYVGISSTGDVTTRNEQLADLLHKETLPVSMLQRVISVRMFGDVAIVSGTYDLKWGMKGRGEREERGIYTHVYAHAQDRWECVNAQRTPVVDLTPGAEKKDMEKQKTSTAEEPFHIPFLHRGARSTDTNPPTPNSPQN